MNFFSPTHLKQATASAYNSKINKWISVMPSDKNTLLYIFSHPYFSIVQIRHYLKQNNIDTAQTIHSYIKSIISATEHNINQLTDIDEDDYIESMTKWKDLRQVYHEYANSYRLEQKPSPTQSVKGGSSLKFTDLIKARDELPDESIDKLLLGFYTYVPPVRSDYFATQILSFGETPSYPNYIFHNSNKSYLKITDFKTSKLYKSIEYELPPELHRLLTISLTNKPRKFLFQNKDANSFSRARFSDWASKRLTSIFKKEFTLTFFRHIFVSTLDLNTPPGKLLEISNKMGHSLTQQMLYKWKEQPNKIAIED